MPSVKTVPTTRREVIERPKMVPRNVMLYYVYRVFCSVNFVMPIFMLFLMDKGLSTFQVFMTQAAYTVAELLLIVPMGAFADKFGRKKTLVMSTVTYAASFAFYGMVETFAQVLLVEMLFAVSSAAFAGTGQAFLYDSLAEKKKEKLYKRTLGTALAIQSGVTGVAAVVGGYLAKYDLSLPFFLTAVPAALSLLPLLFMTEPKRIKPADSSYWGLMKDAAVFVAKHQKVRNVMYYVAATMLTGMMAWMLYQPLLTEEMGMPLEYLGFVMMGLAVASGVGNKLAQVVEERMGHLDLMLVLAGGRALLYALVYLATGPYLVVWALMADLLAGVSGPLVSEWVNKYSKSENRATVLSLSMMSGCLSVSLFSPLLGLFTDAYSVQATYALLALVLLVYAVRQVFMLWLGRR